MDWETAGYRERTAERAVACEVIVKDCVFGGRFSPGFILLSVIQINTIFIPKIDGYFKEKSLTIHCNKIIFH